MGIHTKTLLHKYCFGKRYRYATYIFKNATVRGPQKQCSQLSDMQIQIHKKQIRIYTYTNTDSVPDRPTKDIENNVPECLKFKYTNI